MKNELGIEVCCENCYLNFDCNLPVENACRINGEYLSFLPSIEASATRIKELQEQLELESKLSQKEIKLLNKKIEKLWNRENEYVSCPSQQFKRCEHAKESKSNKALAKVFLSASNMLNDNSSFKQLESKGND